MAKQLLFQRREENKAVFKNIATGQEEVFAVIAGKAGDSIYRAEFPEGNRWNLSGNPMSIFLPKHAAQSQHSEEEAIELLFQRLQSYPEAELDESEHS